ncbi:hypothetical protein M0R72_10365 [Candidatus Pacearchaeota archaeon]|nr:hypothetical protein [Candidatus Pacearchaeota archaeon]
MIAYDLHERIPALAEDRVSEGAATLVESAQVGVVIAKNPITKDRVSTVNEFLRVLNNLTKVALRQVQHVAGQV